jgi:hypothetical protein
LQSAISGRSCAHTNRPSLGTRPPQAQPRTSVPAESAATNQQTITGESARTIGLNHNQIAIGPNDACSQSGLFEPVDLILGISGNDEVAEHESPAITQRSLDAVKQVRLIGGSEMMYRESRHHQVERPVGKGIL